MKRNLTYAGICLFALFGCKNGGLTSIEIEKSFEEPSVKLEEFRKILAANPDGYRMMIQPSSGALISGFIKFETSSAAKFVTDNSLANANGLKDVVYKTSVIQTNAALSLGATSSFATIAAAAGADTAYTYKATTGDTIMLLGNSKATKLSLIKLVKADADSYMAGNLAAVITEFSKFNNFMYYFKRMSVAGKTYDVVLNTRLRFITFNYLDGTTFKSFTTGYTYAQNGVYLNKRFVDGTTIVSNLTGLSANLTSNTAQGKAGDAAFTVSNSGTPLTYNTTAAATFLAGGNTVIAATNNTLSWLSYTGFTVAGVTDAFGVTGILGLNYLSYSPKYNVAYDRLGYIVGGAIAAYGPALVPSVKTNGTIAFTSAGSFGNPAADYTVRVANVRNQFLDALGYYVIQSGPVQFDLVNVRDGSTWISFQ